MAVGVAEGVFLVVSHDVAQVGELCVPEEELTAGGDLNLKVTHVIPRPQREDHVADLK